jgi:S-DNA-T family DNA segregation ATPase FtsK/SpoIIIE
MRSKLGPKPQAKNSNKEFSHHTTDSIGISLIGLAAIMILSLCLGNTGILGNSINYFFKSLFGHGTWLTPVLFIFLGVTILTGKNRVKFNKMIFGLVIVFTTLLALFAKNLNGDYFDPIIVAESGGYLGASIAFVFDQLLGTAKIIGLLVLGIIGIIICLNSPMRSIIQSYLLHIRARRMRSDDEGPEIDETASPVIRKAENNIFKPVEQLSPKAIIHEPVAPPKPIVTDNASKIAKIQFNNPIPKEGYTLPPLNLLSEPPAQPKRSPKEMDENIQTLIRTLEEFKIDANVVEVATGPTITRYEIQLGPGIRVSRITALADNIAMSLAASHVRVEAPIPGKSAIGVEVPNQKPSPVSLRQLCETVEFIENPSRLIVALGQDVSGHNMYADLTKMPHLLIGGATNSGKSIGLATIITSLLLRNTPKDLKLVMIDPKRVELSLFDGIPHLLCPVVKEVKESPGVLRAVWKEMDDRYHLFSEAGVRNIDGWNEKASFQDKLPYIVVIIDELADMMMQAAAEVEATICRLAQLARATGIHLVIATQRPSVDVITGTIKANIPSRIAFAVSSPIDSRTIIDRKGADSLIGRGDMLFSPINENKPIRIQGCYVSETEIEQVCHHWKEQEQPNYILNPMDMIVEEAESNFSKTDSDPLWEECVRFVVERGQASTSMIQRRFSIGFQRASRLLDSMEERRIVGPRDGSRPRDVLVSPMDIGSVLGKIDA